MVQGSPFITRVGSIFHKWSIISVSGAKGHFAFAAGTMSSAQIITDQLNSDDNKDLPNATKAVGISKAGAVENVGDINGDGKGIIEKSGSPVPYYSHGSGFQF